MRSWSGLRSVAGLGSSMSNRILKVRFPRVRPGWGCVGDRWNARARKAVRKGGRAVWSSICLPSDIIIAG